MVNNKIEDASDIPKIRKALPIITWTEYFSNFLHRNFGVINIPLSYVISELDTVPTVELLMMRGKSYSEDYGFLVKEIKMIASHNNPNYKEDNSKLYYYIEEATRTTSYTASINPYQKNIN